MKTAIMKICLVILIGLFPAAIYTQVLNFEWAKSSGGIINDWGQSITTDVSGNVYVTGYYQDTVDFDPGTATFILTSNGLQEIFIQKLDANGNFIWAKSMGGTLDDRGNCVTTDASGNVYVTGHFSGTVDFDPSGSTFNLTSSGDYDVFIQKLDVNGNLIWAKSMGGTGIDEGFSITSDTKGNVYIAGYYYGTVDFDPGTATFNLASNGFSDVFIQKLDKVGNFVWAKSIGGALDDRGNCITTDALGNVYVTGYYSGTVDFDPNTATFNLTSNGLQDIFIQKLDVSGNFIWAKSIGGTSSDRGQALTTDIYGNVYTTGYFKSMVDFDPSGSIFNLTSSGDYDVFIQKLESSGKLIWAKSMGGLPNEFSYSITTDAFGNVYVTGYFSGTVDFDPGLATFNLTSNGNTDGFIQMLSDDGNFRWAYSIGGVVADHANSITIDASGNIYITGNYQFTVDFDPFAATFDLTSNGQGDIFVQKLSQPYLGINENKFLQNLEVFPNPTKGEFTVELGNTYSEISVRITNQTGQVISNTECQNSSIIQQKIEGPPGIYLVQITTNDGISASFKVLKE